MKPEAQTSLEEIRTAILEISTIDHAMVFVVLTKHIPVLKLEVEALLRHHG